MNYIKIPRKLFTDEKYKDLSLDAKVIYAFMLCRFNLLEFKGWKDKNGKTYFIYTSESLSQLVGKSVRIVSRYLGELKKANLIYSKKLSNCHPTFYYLQNSEQFCPVLRSYVYDSTLYNSFKCFYRIFPLFDKNTCVIV